MCSSSRCDDSLCCYAPNRSIARPKQSGRDPSERASTATNPSTQATDLDLPSLALCLYILSFRRATNVLSILPTLQYLNCLLSCSRSAR